MTKELLAEKTIVMELPWEPDKKPSWPNAGVFSRTRAVYMGMNETGNYVGFLTAYVHGIRNPCGLYSDIEATWSGPQGNSGKMTIEEYMSASGEELMMAATLGDGMSARSRKLAKLVKAGEDTYRHEIIQDESH